MYIPKRYGQSKNETCPFCGKQALAVSKGGMPVCADHKDKHVPDLRCACGKLLEQKTSKYGVFYVCMNCGPVSLKRALDINDDAFKNQKPKVTEVRSDDPMYFS